MTRLFHISDIHFGREDQNALNCVESLIKERSPDALVVSGDLTQRGKDDEFRAAYDWLNSLGTPFLTVPGNHDTPMFDMIARVKSPFATYNTFFGNEASSMQVDKVSISGLNSSRGWQVRRNWAEGVINLSDLETVLTGVEQGDGVISVLTCHHPFLEHADAPLKTSTKRGGSAAEILFKRPTSILLTGHVHMPSVEVFRPGAGEGGFISICAGTLSTRLRDFPPSMNELNFDVGTIEVLAHGFPEGGAVSNVLGRWSLESLDLV